MLVGSTFSGIEGMGLAAERAGMTLAWSCEINPDARAVIGHHYPNVKLHGDIAEIGYGPHVPTAVEPVDLLCGGFPCQDLSVAGRRAGLAGARSGLFFEFARLVDEIAPTWFVLENVPGLLSSNDGRDMGTVLGTLADLGYGVAYRVLDAQHFGVPQRRRRVVIVGHSGDITRAGEILFEPEGGGGNPAPSGDKGAVVAALTANGAGTCGADDNQGQAGHLIPTVAPSLTAERGQRNDPSMSTFLPQTLTGEKTHAITSRIGVRRLTPTECERLQGFPDGWTDVPNARGKPMPDSARYRMLGNAVAVPVFEWVFRRIAERIARG